jgi:hypothetical protein
MSVRLSSLRTRRTLLPRNIIICMFLVLISVRSHFTGFYRVHSFITALTRYPVSPCSLHLHSSESVERELFWPRGFGFPHSVLVFICDGGWRGWFGCKRVHTREERGLQRVTERERKKKLKQAKRRDGLLWKRTKHTPRG